MTYINIQTFLGVILGGGAGYMWYRLIGNTMGAFILTANPWLSTIYGAVLGLLVTVK